MYLERMGDSSGRIAKDQTDYLAQGATHALLQPLEDLLQPLGARNLPELPGPIRNP